MQAQTSLTKFTIKDTQIPIIFEHSSLVPTGFMRLTFVGGGSVSDGQHIGIAGLAARLLNEGTKTLGAIKFSEELDKRAIDLSAYKGPDTLNIQLSFLKEKKEDAIKLLSLLISDINLTDTALQKVKQDAINSLLAKENDFDYLANRNLSKILFKNTPFSQKPTAQTIEAITLENLKDYFAKNLVLSKLVIVLGGDINEKDTLQILHPTLSLLKTGSTSPSQHFKANPSEEETILHKETQQAYIYFGSPFELQNLSLESAKAKILGFVLGSSGFGSRLMEEIRVKRGLAYSAYMRINTGKLINYASGYLQTKLENQEESIKIVREVIANFVKNGITQAELDGAKQFLLGSEPLRTETLSQRLDRQFFNYYLGLPLDFNKKELDEIQKINLDEINAYIKKHTELNQLSFSIVTAQDNAKQSSQESPDNIKD